MLQFAENMAALKEELSSLLGLLKIWLRDLLLGEFRDSGFAQDGKIPVKNLEFE